MSDLQIYATQHAHLSLPIAQLSPPLARKLQTIHAGVSVIIDSVAQREECVRVEMQAALEEHRLGRVEEKAKRVEAERELERERERGEKAEKLMADWASEAFKKGAVV